MGAFTDRFVVEGRTLEDFGDAFSLLKPLPIERMYLVQVSADKKLFDPYLLAYGQQDRVTFDYNRLGRYIEGFIDHGFVMLHNHPNGSGPSRKDWEVTKDIIRLSDACGKILYDHCVVSSMNYYLRTIAPELFQCIP